MLFFSLVLCLLALLFASEPIRLHIREDHGFIFTLHFIFFSLTFSPKRRKIKKQCKKIGQKRSSSHKRADWVRPILPVLRYLAAHGTLVLPLPDTEALLSCRALPAERAWIPHGTEVLFCWFLGLISPFFGRITVENSAFSRSRGIGTSDVCLSFFAFHLIAAVGIFLKSAIANISERRRKRYAI